MTISTFLVVHGLVAHLW